VAHMGKDTSLPQFRQECKGLASPSSLPGLFVTAFDVCICVTTRCWELITYATPGAGEVACWQGQPLHFVWVNVTYHSRDTCWGLGEAIGHTYLAPS
jgi:hypothetical protein